MKRRITDMKKGAVAGLRTGLRNGSRAALLYALPGLLLLLFSCKKQLDIKPSLSLQVPVTTADFQAILDNNNVLTQVWPYAGTDGADDGFITDITWASVSVTNRNAYTWEKEVFNDLPRNDWSLPYTAVFYANLALDGSAKYGDNGDTWRNVRGQAAFYRGYSYYQLAQEFCKPYDPATAATDAGLVLRASADLNIKSVRSTVSATYQQILHDLTFAAANLPIDVAAKTRPGKQAAYAMLARTYLVTGDYEKANTYADSSIRLNGKLMNYNLLTAGSSASFKRFNDEVIFHTVLASAPVLLSPRYLIDTTLYSSYETGDLRKPLFFKKAATRPYYNFNGSYDGTTALFNGPATDEIYLIRAETAARLGNPAAALTDLNLLRKNRYSASSYVPLTSNDARQVLGWVLQERRKELVLRGQRWSDLRRLNKEPAYQKTLVKIINGTRYELPPGDSRYTWPIPASVVAETGIPQN
ncbi:RagB/SusD family nutrient uptake outer membrane protein [Mucilaginibacter ginsenosidivorax]|uniref:RagB/SusD family nutrient uptake outer membrane protein n=1 Tax=Mucilaginibacter ginsenosidivorax TaxID=862126 RepID=A0A5B8VUV2_9SPHI|nr:RagB/SusD family nutrient uptake outer membrane protein [Mucilaginibacter ginsenosidivorax]QEC74672.1 RagB/SusD family nutrient uptake outer membrane protein [Mucilaginibacter ginsenosidivorax]